MKAAFLLVVFSLNTFTGFACAVGMDMNFNKGHHQSQIPAAHVAHEHQHADFNHHHNTDRLQKNGGEKENCCKDAATKLTASDKLIQRTFNTSKLSVLFTMLPDITPPQSLAHRLPANLPNTSFSRHCRSPIKDVRIAIQSFQI